MGSISYVVCICHWMDLPTGTCCRWFTSCKQNMDIPVCCEEKPSHPGGSSKIKSLPKAPISLGPVPSTGLWKNQAFISGMWWVTTSSYGRSTKDRGGTIEPRAAEDVLSTACTFFCCQGKQEQNQQSLHPWKFTLNLKITRLKRKIIVQTFIFGFHQVKPPSCVHDLTGIFD